MVKDHKGQIIDPNQNELNLHFKCMYSIYCSNIHVHACLIVKVEEYILENFHDKTGMMNCNNKLTPIYTREAFLENIA